ncbi:MAG: hypothetical protein NWE91_03125 [Candidatus Bathyarchaeota archaeon]|nr:hypothetical protein [Candidatus Bathyarchaeota archaeon]
MEISEKRIIGSLILLAGLTFVSVALFTGQLAKIADLMKSIFEPAVAGLP